ELEPLLRRDHERPGSPNGESGLPLFVTHDHARLLVSITICDCEFRYLRIPTRGGAIGRSRDLSVGVSCIGRWPFDSLRHHATPPLQAAISGIWAANGKATYEVWPLQPRRTMRHEHQKTPGTHWTPGQDDEAVRVLVVDEREDVRDIVAFHLRQ